MRSNALLLTFTILAIGAAAAPLRLESSENASALVGRSHQLRHHQAKGDYHPLPRDASDSLYGESSFELTRRAAGDIDMTKVVDLTNNNGNDQGGQGGNTHTTSGAGSGPSPWQLNESVQSANKGSGAIMPSGACHSLGGCGGNPSALSLQAMAPGGPAGAGGLGLPIKAHDTLPADGSADGSTSGPSADNASPDASKQDNNNTTSTTLSTAPNPNPISTTAPAPTAPVVGTPLPMNLLAAALIDIIKAFEKATTPINPTVNTSLAATPAPAPVLTPSNTTATPDVTNDNTPDDTNAADSAGAAADSADTSAQDAAAGSRRGSSEAEGVDGPFKWIVMRGNGAEKPEAASAKRSVNGASPAGDKLEAAKRRILDTESE